MVLGLSMKMFPLTSNACCGLLVLIPTHPMPADIGVLMRNVPGLKEENHVSGLLFRTKLLSCNACALSHAAKL